jgi:hypothetical protein
VRRMSARSCSRATPGAEPGWTIYSFHHLHSTAHEVLGIVAGSAAVILGGPGGRRFDVRRGDVLVLPAGKMRSSPTSPPCRARYRPGPRKDGPLTEIWRTVA